MCAEEGSQTIFNRKSTILMNRAAGSGGGVFNAGVALFETSVTFRGNDAAAEGAMVPATAAAAVRALVRAFLRNRVLEWMRICVQEAER